MSIAPPSVNIGHVGLFVRNLDMMLAFYRETLGFVMTDRGERICFLSRDPRQHHQVVLVPGRAPDGPDQVQQLSFRVDTLEEVQTIHNKLVAAGIKKLEPVTHGNAWSVYFRDPEGNRLEFYCDTPWHVPQPFRRDVDYSQSIEQIYATTKAICEATPGYKPIEQYYKELGQRIAGQPAHA